MKHLARFLFVFLVSAHQSSWGCHPRPDPMYGVKGPADLAEFESIYVGSVVGLRLTSTIAQLEKNLDSDSELGIVEVIGGTSPFEFEVFADQVLKGAVVKLQMAVAGGCNVRFPEMMQRVIVFRRADATARYFSVEKTGASYIDLVKACALRSCDNAIGPFP
jgi:hypothetical protein